jgi:hypothetical protein
MTGRDDQFVRLLRWYPQFWRDVLGAVFVDTLREQSEHDGRTGPSRGETFAAVVNGLGTRLDARLAGTMALAGIALTAIGQIIFATLAPSGIVDPVQNGLLSAYLGAVAMLVLAGLVAIGRTYGVLPAGRALAVLALGWAAMALFSGGTYAWAFGFQLAEDNQAMTGVAVAAGPLFGGAMTLGLVAGWLCMDGVLSRTRLRRVLRVLLSVLAGGALAVFGGYAVLMQTAWVSIAVGVVALSLRSLGAWPNPRPLSAGASTHRFVRPLAAVSAGIGILGIAYAVTGAAWSAAAHGDQTVAGSQAILALLVGALPLVVALGLLAARRDHRPQHVWGPLALVGVVIGTVFYAYTDAPSSTRIEPALTIGSALLGLAIAWWVTARLGGSRRDRWVAGASITLACMVVHGAALLPVAVFVMPFLAGILAVRGELRLRRARTAKPANAPVAGA